MHTFLSFGIVASFIELGRGTLTTFPAWVSAGVGSVVLLDGGSWHSNSALFGQTGVDSSEQTPEAKVAMSVQVGVT
jgi:hypothetical protein